jgi:hypothetical protein
MDQHLRVRVTGDLVVQVGHGSSPFDGGSCTQTERSLVMNIDAIGDVRECDDIDIVGGIGRSWHDRRRLN